MLAGHHSNHNTNENTHHWNHKQRGVILSICDRHWPSNFWLTDANRLGPQTDERIRIEAENNGAQSKSVTHIQTGPLIIQTLSQLLQLNQGCGARLPSIFIVLLLVLYAEQAHFPHCGGNWPIPLPPALRQLQLPLSGEKKKKNIQCKIYGFAWITGDYGPCATAFRKGYVSVYSWMCCSAGDSSSASVIKAEGMSILWTQPNSNPLAWHEVGRGEGRRGWRDEG